MSVSRELRSQSGSLPMALLAALIVGGLVVVLVARLGTTQREVRFDRDFQLAVNAAEAGLQQALTSIQQLPQGAPPTEIVSEPDDDPTLGDSTFTWRAVPLATGGWGVRAEGTRNGVSRTLEAEARQDCSFCVAAFGRIGLRMVGNNLAASYNGAVEGGLIAGTGSGSVGSNGLVSIIGNSTADYVKLNGIAASCGDNFYDEDANTCNDVPIDGSDDPLDFDLIIETVQGEMDEHCSSYPPLTLDKNATLELSNDEIHCFGDVILDDRASLTVDGTFTEPVQVYIKGNLELGNDNRVNCPLSGCDYVADVNKLPVSGALRISTLGPEVRIGNKGDVAAAILAPISLCRGNPSSAQTNIYGSLVCHQVGNDGSGSQGGWSFYFDTRLLTIGNGNTELQGIREEVGGSTSFAGS